jgi:hypothetical protein
VRDAAACDADVVGVEGARADGERRRSCRRRGGAGDGVDGRTRRRWRDWGRGMISASYFGVWVQEEG